METIDECLAGRKDKFRVSHVFSHLGSKGVDSGRVTALEEYMNRGRTSSP